MSKETKTAARAATQAVTVPPAKGQRELAHKPELRNREPEYFWDRFYSYLLDSYSSVGISIEAAEHTIATLSSRAVALGLSNGLIPGDCDHETIDDIKAICSTPVEIKDSDLPSLFRYFRACLYLERLRELEQRYRPFYWEYMGDDTAADWKHPDTPLVFAVIFAEMLETFPPVAREWAESGLTIDDLIYQDEAEEPDIFTLKVVAANS